MNKLSSFEQFFISHAGEVSLTGIALNILLAALLCGVLGWFYINFGTSLSNRKNLAKNFVLVGVTTTLVITIVKASLALSLGLVGALSIVRFRAAIKEPEELAFLFLTIGIGLGFGADQKAATMVSFVFILLSFLVYRFYVGTRVKKENFFFTVRADRPPGDDDGDAKPDDFLATTVEIISRFTTSSVLKRFERHEEFTEAVFLVEVDSLEALKGLDEALSKSPGNSSFTFVEDMRVA